MGGHIHDRLGFTILYLFMSLKVGPSPGPRRSRRRAARRLGPKVRARAGAVPRGPAPRHLPGLQTASEKKVTAFCYPTRNPLTASNMQGLQGTVRKYGLWEGLASECCCLVWINGPKSCTIRCMVDAGVAGSLPGFVCGFTSRSG